MEQDERALLHSLVDDLHGSFIQVVQRYQQRLYVFACRLAGPQEAEDILQEAFVNAYVSLENYEPERICSLKLRPWLYRIVLHVYGHHTRAARLNLVPLAPFAEGGDLLLEDDPEERPEVLFEQQEQRATLEALIAQLPEASRVAITCYYFESLSYQEIADLLDQPLGTVKPTRCATSCYHAGSVRFRFRLGFLWTPIRFLTQDVRIWRYTSGSLVMELAILHVPSASADRSSRPRP